MKVVLLFHHHPHTLAIHLERGNEGGENDDTGVDEQTRHLADSADVFGPVILAESQIAAQSP